MKGTLRKTKHGLEVDYKVINQTPIGIKYWWETLSIHPKYISDFQIETDMEVEFEIVKEYTDNHTNQVQTYAKLIKPLDRSKTDQKIPIPQPIEDYKLWLESQIDKCLEDKDLQREHWAFCKAYEKLSEIYPK